MKKILMITAIVALMSSCKKTEIENPQPCQMPNPSHQIITGLHYQEQVSGGLYYYYYMPPTGWKVDSINLYADRYHVTESDKDFMLLDNHDNILPPDFTSNITSLYNKWWAVNDTIQGIKVYLYSDAIWNELQISISKR